MDDRPERIGLRYPAQVGLCGDAKLTLQELKPLLERRPDRSFLEQAQAEMNDWRELQAHRALPRYPIAQRTGMSTTENTRASPAGLHPPARL